MSLPPVRTAAGIAYRESGKAEAPAVVLLHGIGSTSAVWEEQYEPLGARFRVVAWTAPGYDRSAPLSVLSPSVFDYASALSNLLDALKIGEADLVTNSWGTLVALGFANAYPKRVRSLVLGGPTVGSHGRSAEERKRLTEERIARIRHLGAKAMRAQDIPRLISETATPRARALAAGMGEFATVEGYAQAVRMLYSTDGVELIAALDKPVLIISGTEDRTTPPETNARKLEAAAKRARFEAVPGCGHLPHLEKPEVFSRLVLGFLAG